MQEVKAEAHKLLNRAKELNGELKDELEEARDDKNAHSRIKQEMRLVKTIERHAERVQKKVSYFLLLAEKSADQSPPSSPYSALPRGPALDSPRSSQADDPGDDEHSADDELDQLVEISVQGPSRLLQSVQRAGMDIFHVDLKLQLGPLSRISLGAKRLQEMDVDPTKARYFAFVYPCEQFTPGTEQADGVDQDLLREHISPFTEALHALITFGGFVYFDQTGLPIRYLAFIDEGHSTYMHFEDAQRVPEKLDLHLHTRLFRTKRFRPTTFTQLRERGAMSFAWLRPGELIDMLEEVSDISHKAESATKEEEEEEQLSIAYGAFAYTTVTRSEQHGRSAVFFPLRQHRYMRKSLENSLAKQKQEGESARPRDVDKVICEYISEHSTHFRWYRMYKERDAEDGTRQDGCRHLQLLRQWIHCTDDYDGNESIVDRIAGLLKFIEEHNQKKEAEQQPVDQAQQDHSPQDQDVWDLVNESDSDGTTPIFKAVERNNLALVELLLENGADLRAERKPQGQNEVQTFVRLTNSGDAKNTTRPMLLAAARGYHDIVRVLCLACWRYSDFDTSVAAGRALDDSFEEALKRRKFDQAKKILLPCFLRNDGYNEVEAALKTLEYAIRIVSCVVQRLHDIERGSPEKLEAIAELKEIRTDVQFMAAAFLEELTAAQVDRVLTSAWKERDATTSTSSPQSRAPLFQMAVDNDCVEFLSSAKVRTFLRRKWRGSLVNMLRTGSRRYNGVVKTIKMSQLIVLWSVFLLAILPFNLLVLLPVVTVWPPLSDVIKHRLEACGELWLLNVRWRSLYILQDAMLKFVLHEASNILLALLLYDVVPKGAAVQLDQRFFLSYAWLISEVFGEVHGMMEHPRIWFQDKLNLLELPAWFTAFTALTLILIPGQIDDDPDGELPRAMIGASLVAMLLATLLRIASLTESLGALVRMTEYMVRDVLKWLLLMLLFVISFATGMYQVLRGLDIYDDYDSQSGCREFVQGLQNSWTSNVLHVFEIAIGASSDDDFHCMRSNVEQVDINALQTMGRVLTIIWMITSIALAMNMLIAMMSKSFDLVWTKHLAHVWMVFACSALVWHFQPPAPSPLSLLSLPYYGLSMLGSAWSSISSWLDDRHYEKLRGNSGSGGGGGGGDAGGGGSGGGSGGGGVQASRRHAYVRRTFTKKDIADYEKRIKNFVALASAFDEEDGFENTEQNEFRMEIRDKLGKLEKAFDEQQRLLLDKVGSLVKDKEQKKERERMLQQRQRRAEARLNFKKMKAAVRIQRAMRLRRANNSPTVKTKEHAIIEY